VIGSRRRPASLVVRNVTLAYGPRTVLTDVNLEVQAGEFVGLIGPNACGKSTLLKAVSRILRPASGEILIDGRNVWKEMNGLETARTLAVVPQDFPAVFPLTVEQTVTLGRTPFVGRFSGEKPRDFARVRAALEATGTLAVKDRIFTELCGGERQRVILAKALAQEPRLLLLDEPTSHLDINHQVEIMDLLVRLNREDNLTVLIVLHDLNLAAVWCRRLFLFGGGRLVASGHPREVLTADNLAAVYGSPVLVERHPVYGCPQVALLSRLPQGAPAAPGRGDREAGPRRPADRPVRKGPVHVIAGGGTSVDLLETLAAAGYEVTVGPLNAGDSDWQAARALGADVVTVPPFCPVDQEAGRRAGEMMYKARAVLVGPVPFGPGNVDVLRTVLEAARTGLPVGVLVGGPAPARAGGSLTRVLKTRDFAGGRATAFGPELERAGARALAGPAEALAWLETVTGGRVAP